MTTRILDLPDASMGIGNNAGGPPPPVQVGKNQMGQTAMAYLNRKKEEEARNLNSRLDS